MPYRDSVSTPPPLLIEPFLSCMTWCQDHVSPYSHTNIPSCYKCVQLSCPHSRKHHTNAHCFIVKCCVATTEIKLIHTCASFVTFAYHTVTLVVYFHPCWYSWKRAVSAVHAGLRQKDSWTHLIFLPVSVFCLRISNTCASAFHPASMGCASQTTANNAECLNLYILPFTFLLLFQFDWNVD